MPSWVPWLFLVALLVLPVLLRLYVGDEPDNALVHQQENKPRQDPDAELAVAARGLLRTTGRHASQ